MKYLFISSFLLCSVFVQAQSADWSYVESMYGLGDITYHKLHYAAFQQDYHIYVRKPRNWTSDQKYPAIYLLDGGTTFPMFAGFQNYLEWGKEIPPCILVGISYGASDRANGNNRSRDFTAPSVERTYWGGAEEFSEFLSTQLFPLLEKTYAANPEKRIVFGQSLGGQYALYAAQFQPDLFWGHIASNPALHRNLKLFLEPLETQASSEARIFVGSAENDDARFREPALEWIAHWEQQPKLPWALLTATIDGHTHFTAGPEVFWQGLQWIFARQ